MNLHRSLNLSKKEVIPGARKKCFIRKMNLRSTRCLLISMLKMTTTYIDKITHNLISFQRQLFLCLTDTQLIFPNTVPLSLAEGCNFYF